MRKRSLRSRLTPEQEAKLQAARSRGGKARAARMTPEERSAAAKHAHAARYAKEKERVTWVLDYVETDGEKYLSEEEFNAL